MKIRLFLKSPFPSNVTEEGSSDWECENKRIEVILWPVSENAQMVGHSGMSCHQSVEKESRSNEVAFVLRKRLSELTVNLLMSTKKLDGFLMVITSPTQTI